MHIQNNFFFQDKITQSGGIREVNLASARILLKTLLRLVNPTMETRSTSLDKTTTELREISPG